MQKRIDLTGRKFERLKVISYAGTDKSGKTLWNCECKCGNSTISYGQNLKNGTAKSCGCLQKEKLIQRSKTHGQTNSRLYQIWHDMKERTQNRNNKNYKRYGGRGIKVCAQWKKFDDFRKWALDNGYKENLTIERINNNGNYCPENCRWATKEEQNRNKRDNVILEYKGERKILADWAKDKGMSYACLKNRIKRGWSIEKALETPVKK